MIIYVSGGSGSGKSAFAEGLIVRGECSNRLYIATMQPFGEEAARRIRRHRQQRSGKGFQTIECPTDLAALFIKPNHAVLLEDLSNLLANEWFSSRRDGAEDRVLSGLCHLTGQADLTVIVGNDVFSDGSDYDGETAAYLAALARTNTRAAAMADEAYEVVCGIPIRHK